MALFSGTSFLSCRSQVQSIFHDHGVVCVPREGKDVRKFVFENDMLYEYRVSFSPLEGLTSGPRFRVSGSGSR